MLIVDFSLSFHFVWSVKWAGHRELTREVIQTWMTNKSIIASIITLKLSYSVFPIVLELQKKKINDCNAICRMVELQRTVTYQIIVIVTDALENQKDREHAKVVRLLFLICILK